jgi:hypothetical protein
LAVLEFDKRAATDEENRTLAALAEWLVFESHHCRPRARALRAGEPWALRLAACLSRERARLAARKARETADVDTG